jgi:hypothetical protein
MEEIAARRAADLLLAQHKANQRFKAFGPPDAPASIKASMAALSATRSG